MMMKKKKEKMMSDRYLQSLADDYMEDECNRADQWNEIEWEIIHACETGEPCDHYDPAGSDFITENVVHHQKHILFCLANGLDADLLDLLKQCYAKEIATATEYAYDHSY